MAVKRNRWLVISVLVVAVGAFLALSVLPFFTTGSQTTTATSPGNNPSEENDPLAELEARARGYELVLEREPDNQTAIEGLVDARIQLGDREGVIAPLEKLAELNPNTPEYRVLLGQAKQSIGDLEGAADEYRTVLTQRPGDMNALQGLTALLLQQERPQAAVGLLQDTLQSAPQANEVTPGAIDVISVQLLLAQVYVEEGDIDEALQVYDDAIDAAEDDFRPVLAKALVLRDTGREPDAAVLFKQAEELAPAQFKDQVRQLAAGEDTAPAAGLEGEALIPAESPATPEPVDDSGTDAAEPEEAEADGEFIE